MGNLGNANRILYSGIIEINKKPKNSKNNNTIETKPNKQLPIIFKNFIFLT